MGKLRANASFGLGGAEATDSVFSKNHFASDAKTSPEVRQKIASMGLNRVAGNIYECPSTKDFWKVQGNKVIKMVGSEVDNHETMASADATSPQISLRGFLDDLEF